MSVTLKKLTNDTFRECISLKVAPEQENYVASNMYSLAEAQADGVSNPRAIYADDQMVGFIMYDFEPKESRGYITRLMVDQRFQRRGYGRSAVQQVIERFRDNPACKEIYTSIHPENEGASKLYQSLGLILTGEMEDGEAVLRMKVNQE